MGIVVMDILFDEATMTADLHDMTVSPIRDISMRMSKCIEVMEDRELNFFAIETVNFAVRGKVAKYKFVAFSGGEGSRLVEKAVVGKKIANQYEKTKPPTKQELKKQEMLKRMKEGL